MNRLVAFLCAAALAGAWLPSPAFAFPGDAASAVAARMKARGFAVTSTISELGGNRVYQALKRFRGVALGFYFQAGIGGRSYAEIIRLDAPHFSFLDPSDERIPGAIALVYDRSVAQDFAASSVVATAGIFHEPHRTLTFRRGRRFGYTVDGQSLTLLRLSDLAREIANAKSCATRDCGD